ncbi:hypothetical protein ACI7BZ_05560 [Xanthobacter sp. AM11]|uniref:hypothetical protein n=1 Tax=Xanthobacter sp. AM11 TaxID=3380643 RepID=UPI0039BF1B7C
MTKIECNNNVLMYEGILSEFYLDNEGRFTYIVLQNCYRYSMEFNSRALDLHSQLPLFKDQFNRSQIWNYLTISGENIANVLFEKVGSLDDSAEGTQVLDEAISTDQAVSRP